MLEERNIADKLTPEHAPDGGAPGTTRSRFVVITVMFIGALVVGIAMPILLRSLRSSFDRSGPSLAGIEGIAAFAYVGLGLGLIIRREIARQVFVWFMSFGLTLICIEAIGGAIGGDGFLRRAGAQLVPIVVLTHPAVKRVFS
jgi:hypothetical protein